MIVWLAPSTDSIDEGLKGAIFDEAWQRKRRKAKEEGKGEGKSSRSQGETGKKSCFSRAFQPGLPARYGSQ